MNPTPIADLLDSYAAAGAARFHMPGHKGRPPLGDPADITEIDGAGNLFADEGPVAESEAVASAVFGCRTYYSTEGSSLAIRTMLAAAVREGNRTVLAARNAHRSFLSAAVLLDLDVRWLYPPAGESYLACPVTADSAARAIDALPQKPAVLYLTTPDYLGNVTELKDIAGVCRARGVLLAVDNAHGAYLKFLRPSLHPIDCGADLCADSAHKTLPVLTGGAYLHLSTAAEARFGPYIKHVMALFATSSPSYLILRSLDLANRYLETYPARLAAFLPRVERLKAVLREAGWSLCGTEPLKLTLAPKARGYTGDEVSALLREAGVIAEFHDPDYVTFLFTPENTEEDLVRLQNALAALPPETPVPETRPVPGAPRPVLSPRQAFFAPCERIPAAQCPGRILADAAFLCPPAVPIAAPGERLDEAAAALFRYYGIKTVDAVKE